MGMLLNQSQQDLLMDWTWEMEQRRELSRAPPGPGPEHLGGWGEPFPETGMTAVGVGRSRDGVGDKIFFSRSLKSSRWKSNVAEPRLWGRLGIYPGNTIPAKNGHLA